MTQFVAWLDDLQALLGQAVVTDARQIAPHLEESRGRFQGQCGAFVQPKTVAEVQKLMVFCHDRAIAVVPQGGNTGHVGGAVGQAGAVLLSLSKLNHIQTVDPIGATMRVEAGCVLQRVQEVAAAYDLMFPLSLASQGSCQIGGVLATNAGGVHVVKYGTMRDLVLGLEVILPDGRKIDALRALPKNNTGYDLKHLFIGSEGTLGIITAAVLKLVPAPSCRETVFFACNALDDVMQVFQQMRAAFGTGVEAFEMMAQFGFEVTCRHTVGGVDPFAQSWPWYGLVDVVDYGQVSDLKERLLPVLEALMDQGVITEGLLAQNLSQAHQWWQMREGMSEAQKKVGASLKHDVAVPIAQLVPFMNAAETEVRRYCSEALFCSFGHVGDGNIHYNISQPPSMDRDRFVALRDDIASVLHGLAESFGGTFSAEHGVGRIKRAELARYRGGAEYEVMQTIKQALDPHNLMNPDVLFEHFHHEKDLE